MARRVIAITRTRVVLARYVAVNIARWGKKKKFSDFVQTHRNDLPCVENFQKKNFSPLAQKGVELEAFKVGYFSKKIGVCPKNPKNVA